MSFGGSGYWFYSMTKGVPLWMPISFGISLGITVSFWGLGFLFLLYDESAQSSSNSNSDIENTADASGSLAAISCVIATF